MPYYLLDISFFVKNHQTGVKFFRLLHQLTNFALGLVLTPTREAFMYQINDLLSMRFSYQGIEGLLRLISCSTSGSDISDENE